MRRPRRALWLACWKRSRRSSRGTPVCTAGLGIPVLVDAAQLAPHRPLPGEVDVLAWSGHKMYAPFGTGVPVGPRRVLAAGDRSLAGGAGFEPGRGETGGTAAFLPEDQGSPNVIGAVALRAAIGAVEDIGWPSLARHDHRIAASPHRRIAAAWARGDSRRSAARAGS